MRCSGPNTTAERQKGILMSYVIDRNGNRKKVPPGYVVQHGESAAREMHMMDGAGRTFITDTQTNDGKVAIGDAVTTDQLGTATRLRFSDGTSALIPSDGYVIYCDAAGNQAHSLSLEQQAHMAKRAGNLSGFTADTIERRANILVAHSEMTERQSNAWRNA